MPAMVLAACAAAIASLWSGRARLAAALLAALPAALVFTCLSMAALYPSARRVVPFAALPGVLGLAAVALSFRRKDAALAMSAGIALGALDGFAWARAWRADTASTNPAGAPEPDAELAPSGSLYVNPHGRALHVSPSLTFWSCSPDRFLTVLVWPPHCPPVESEVAAASEGDGSTRLVAITRVGADVYSHLNAFSVIELSGIADRPFVSFSPAPDARIEIVAGEYPFGAPYRLAYLGDDGVFRVVEASSGEKGPFHELAAGPLRRGDALTITLWDGGLALADVTFEDFAAQASTELSPTAGWGLPQNAIQFSREGSGASLVLTLASTSIGRGFDSVGHRAGTYRNRVRVTPR